MSYPTSSYPPPLQAQGLGAASDFDPLHFVFAAVALAFSAGLLYLAFQGAEGGAQGAISVLRPFTLMAFVAALVVFFASENAGGKFYPIVLFAFLLEASQSMFSIVWTAAPNYFGVYFDYQLFSLSLLATMAAMTGIFGLVLTAASLLRLVRGSEVRGGPLADFATQGSATSPGEIRERAKVKTYFKPTPKWPILMILGGLSLLLFATFGSPYEVVGFYYPPWSVGIEVVFLLALYFLVSDGARTIHFLDLAPFLIGIKIVDSIHEYITTQWIAPAYGENFWNEAWLDQVSRYLLVVGIALLVYGLVYRFFIYRRARRASDGELDGMVQNDMRSMVEHALARLGVEPSRLISPPLSLRGVPDRDAVQGAFVGLRIGKDDVLRFTPQRTTVMGFTDDQVHFYEGTVDLTTGRIIHETVVEFFYQDVSNVARVNGTQSIGLRQAWSLRQSLMSLFSRRKARRRSHIMKLAVGDTVQFEGKDLFQINLESGRALAVVLKDDSFFDTSKKRIVGILRSLTPAAARSATSALSLYRSELPVDDNERVMRAIRTLIRDKKRALLQEKI